MVHETVFVLVNHVFLSRLPFQTRLDVFGVSETVETVIDAADQVPHERAGEAQQAKWFGVAAPLKQAEFAILSQRLELESELRNRQPGAHSGPFRQIVIAAVAFVRGPEHQSGG